MERLETVILKNGDFNAIAMDIETCETEGFTCTNFIVKDARQSPNAVYDYFAVMQRPIINNKP